MVFIGRLRHYNYLFPIGVYEGTSKPKDFNQYIAKFVADINETIRSGLALEQSQLSIESGNVIMDSPARSAINNTKQAPGYYCCHKCYVQGEYIHSLRTISFYGINHCERTHYEYVQKEHYTLSKKDTYHLTQECTAIEQIIHMDIVKKQPIDYMHIACLGVMKRLLDKWIAKVPNFVMTVNDITDKLKDFWPTFEFKRKYRNLSQISSYKACEYRAWLLYHGPAILCQVLPYEMFQHFCLLHHAMRKLFASENPSSANISFAQKCIDKFLLDWPTIYPDSALTYVVHALQHLPNDCIVQGCSPDGFSAFPFESYLRKVTSYYHTGGKALEQVRHFLMHIMICPKH